MNIDKTKPVYHVELGKGYILTTKYRKDDALIACYFPARDGLEFITYRQLIKGMYEITYKPAIRLKKGKDETLEDLLGSILKG